FYFIVKAYTLRKILNSNNIKNSKQIGSYKERITYMNILKNILDVKKFNNEEFSNLNIGVEIQSFPQHILDDGYSELIETYKEKLSGFKGMISMHGSSFDLNPGTTDKKILEVTRYRYLESIKIATELGAKYVIFHSQLNPLISVAKIRTLKLENQIKFWRDLLIEIENLDITILIENEYDDNYEELLYILKSVGHSKLKVCLDIGHALAYSNIPLESWFTGLNEYIEYIHLHWNDTTGDYHNSPSIENFKKLNNIFKNLDKTPIVSLEYGVDDLIEEIRRIRQYLL
ncbi:MAG: sugar phosphate isomerase/epimerase family protein, partial [Paraclostridium sp.]